MDKNQLDASISIKEAIAGKKTNCKLTVRIGKRGIAKGGTIKILFRAISDAGIPQFTHPERENYLKIKLTKKQRLFTLMSSKELPVKIHERPWWNGFVAKTETGLKPDEIITFVFRNWVMQTFLEEEFILKIFVDELNTGRFKSVNNPTKFRVLPDKPVKLEIISPTTVSLINPFYSLVRFLDKWGNLVGNSGIPKIQLNTSDIRVRITKTKNLNSGRILITAVSDAKNPFYFYTNWRKKTWKSNFILTLKNNVLNQYWGDLHWQSEAFKGAKELEKGFDYAKNNSLLDVTSHQGNDFQVTDKFWNETNNLCTKFTVNAKHIALPGFEWSGNTSVGGDHNVIFEKTGLPIVRSADTFIGKTEFKKYSSPNINILFEKLKTLKAVVVAHAGGRKADLKYHDPAVQRLVEVYSCWGLSEDLFFDSLKRGYKLGVVANSDGHMLRPGAECPGNSGLFKVGGGLTCILAKDLTAKSIFDALYSRHCYATSGKRSYLEFSISTESGKVLIMGDQGLFTKGTVFQANIKLIPSGKLKSVVFSDNFEKVKEFEEPNKSGGFFELNNFKLNNLKPGKHAFFIKAVEEDNMVWSSPIFVDIK